MKPHGVWRYRGLFVIVLWQAAPGARTTEDGYVEFGFGYGFAQAEEIFYPGCESEAQQAHFRRKTHVLGASVNARPSERLRFSGTASFADGDSSSVGGAEVTALLAGEWKWFGAGAGFMAGGSGTGPALYLRVGRADQLHLRFDAPAATSPVHTTGMVRAGVGYGLSDARRVGGFLGFATCHMRCDWDDTSDGDSTTSIDAEGWRADLQIPLSSAFNLDLSGFTAAGGQVDDWGVALGVRLSR